MSAFTLPQTAPSVKHYAAEPTTLEERAARVEALKNFTPDDYDHMLKIVRRVIPQNTCDPAEALQEALIIALKKYDGRTKISSFLSKRARWYALGLLRKQTPPLPFSDLPTRQTQEEDAVDDHLDQILGGTEDREYSENVDERFAERIKQILPQLHDNPYVYQRPSVIPVAEKILDLYQTNANRGTGTGVDEWENAAPTTARTPNDRLRSNKKKPKGAIRRNLTRELDATTTLIDHALGALRISTARALREGWLDYHSNPTA